VISLKGDARYGETIFNTNCSVCHQIGGEGKVGFAPSIRNRDFLAIASDIFIEQSIIKGRYGTTMFPIPDLKGQRVMDIIAYLRALPIKNPIKNPIKKIDVDPNKKIRAMLIKDRKSF